ncbi:hypothetical protein [Stenotrophomonas forensis]|uniref:hypothetical protein n=1 Tax=Stenotrophomonas forensis TaxID=2871169 RepID=UPI0039C735E2
MSRKITYSFDNPYAGYDAEDHGELEFPDGTSDEDVEEEVKQLFFERYNFGWSDKDESPHG